MQNLHQLLAMTVAAAALLAAGQAPNARGQDYTVLLSFTGTGGAYPGSFPMGSFVLSGSTLYGMTAHGGANDKGTIFSIGTDGSGFDSFYSFSGGTGGDQPHHGSLAISGSTLYGMTLAGGASGNGNVFSISTDGSSYANLVSFSGSGGPTPGSQPHGDLIVSGTTLYGMTSGGTISGYAGNAFAVGADGGNFQNLLTFSGSGGADPGANPHGGLILSGSTLYGMTTGGSGGATDNGNVFSAAPDGTGFQSLIAFSGSGSAVPYPGATPGGGRLIQSGSTLYGITSAGGADGYGNVFSMNLDGSNYQSLLSFSGSSGSYLGNSPWCTLALSGTTLYGMTESGGLYNTGTIFSLGTDGSNFQSLLSFSGSAGPCLGAAPMGSLTLSGSTLYGMTFAGGANNAGVVFALNLVPEPSTLALLGVGAMALVRRRRSRPLKG